jgi:hypothetical protein
MLCLDQAASPHRLNKSWAAVFKRLHPKSMVSWCSSGWRHNHERIQWIARGITCKKECRLHGICIVFVVHLLHYL